MYTVRLGTSALLSLLVFICLPAQLALSQTQPAEGVEITLDLLEPIHLQDAEEYGIYLDEDRSEPLTLRHTPISQWVNPRRAGGQLGHVFVWMDGERPAAMAAIFSFPWKGVARDRRLVHELHALAPTRLYVERNGGPSKWQPKSGLSRKPISDVSDAANSIARFKIRLRQVARRFSGYCVDDKSQRWELRILPAPLLTYPLKTTRDSQGFGAIVGMMGDVGSDLESGLLIEAVSSNEKDNASAKWSFAPIRMTDMETHLLLDGQPIWDSVRTETDTSFYDSAHVYFRFQDKTVPINSEP